MAVKPVHVLVVEDDMDDFIIIQKMLSRLKNQHFQLERVSEYGEAMKKLGQNVHDVCLLDYRLEGRNGLDFLKEVVQKGLTIPIIFLTGQGDYEVDVEAMQLGASDFLFKNKIDAEMLDRSIRYALERRKAEESRLRLATIVESSNDAIYSVTLNGVIISWNPGAQRIYGFEPQEISGRSLSLIIPDRQENDFPRLLDIVRKGKAVDNFLASHQTKNGDKVLLSLTLSPIKDPQGKVILASVIGRDVTESERSKVIKERLQAERDQLLERLQLQMEWMPIACVLTDENFQFTYWNPTAERMFGFAFKEIEGKTAKDTITPSANDLTRIRASHEQIKKGEGSNQGEVWSNLRKDGTKVLCEWYYTPLKDEEGKLVGSMGMAIDVTERKKAEEAKLRLAAILEQTEEAVIGTDLQGNILDWNKGAEKMYGYRAKEVLGKPVSLLEGENRKGEIREKHEAILAGKSPLFYETQRRRKNGQLFHVAITLTAQKNEVGKIAGFSAIARDITEQKKAEEVQSQLAAILQQTPDAVIGSDLDSNVFSWNLGAEKMFGYSQAEIMGEPMTRLAPEDRQHESVEMGDIAAGGESISNFETVRLKKNGEAIDVSITLSPIRDTRGRIVGVSSISRDISERKQAEESLRKHEEQMRLVEKMNAIGRLAGGVAHDFNNLLSVIGGNAEFLMGSLDKDSSHREEVEEIQKAVRRGAELTKQLLVFGQKQVVKPGPVNLNDLTAEMNKMLKRLIDAAVELSILEDKNLKPILADSGQMQQVILNLVLNARDAMPAGGHLILETRNLEEKDLEAEQRPTLPKASYVRLSVTDSGTGMAPEIQRHIFEPFFTTKAGKGTGLGLASVYGIVTKWSGHIFVHSSPGMGTTFTMYFPAMLSVEGFEAKPNQVSLMPQGSETILVVEDEDPLRKVLVRTLGKYGYKILEAPNGIEAVKTAWKFTDKVDLLLTDTVMPKMNGKELADELHKTRPKMKVLFISGYPKEILSQQGILGADIRLVQKPFELEDLGREIRNVLDEK